jgi:acetate kinase
MEKYLIVNTGSVSAKYSIYSKEAELFFAHFEIEDGKSIVTFFDGGSRESGVMKKITDKIFNNSLRYFIDEAISKRVIADKNYISSIAVRIVAPGTYFQSDRAVDQDFISKIIDQREEAPLHIEVTLKEINKLKEVFPDTRLIGISDSSYYKNIPDVSRYYSIPKKVSEDLDLYHFGYHGISVASIINKLSDEEKLPSKIIVCHLGGGVSVVAVKDGKAFNTSMGYSPLEGLTMATRAGDMDPTAVLYLGQRLGKNPTELENYLNTECGLLGLSGKSSDVRDLLAAEKTDANSKLALEKFVMNVKKYVGAFSAEMGGADMIVFSGSIGERSFIMRGRILSGLEYMGVKFDMKINNKIEGVDGEISAKDSKVKVRVICTNEMKDMAERLIKF